MEINFFSLLFVWRSDGRFSFIPGAEGEAVMVNLNGYLQTVGFIILPPSMICRGWM